jgi:predicted O-methyltransferase YrrM
MDGAPRRPPRCLADIERDTQALGFTMASDRNTGAFLRTLAASRPHGRLLELGTGTGLATAWLLDGMDERSTLLTADDDERVLSVARRHLAGDARVTFALSDGAELLSSLAARGETYDLVFADTWPGKYTHLDDALRLVRVGGLYVVDDMLPQPNRPDEHPAKVAAFLERVGSHPELHVSMLAFSTGLIVAVRTKPPAAG